MLHYTQLLFLREETGSYVTHTHNYKNDYVYINIYKGNTGNKASIYL